VTNIDGSGYNYTDITGYNAVRLREKEYDTVVLSAAANRIDMNRAVFLSEDVVIDDP
jgi:hypothetical protein